jgi:type I restriction enzyme, R subunit
MHAPRWLTYRSFKERLEESIRAYLNHSVQSAEVINTLVQMALDLRGIENRAASLGMTDEEIAFYDVLARGGQEAIEASEPLRALVRDLVATIKSNLGIDWTDHESMQAKVRAAVKRMLRRSGMKPAEIGHLLPTIMEQAQSLYHDWPMAA